MTKNNKQIHEYRQIIDRYIEKWDKILFSTQPVDRDKATKAVIDAYKAIDLSPPEIFFLSSPSLEQNLNFISLSGEKERYPIQAKSILVNKIFKILDTTKLIDEVNLHPGLLEDSRDFDYLRGEIYGKVCNILYEQHVYDVHCRYNENFHKILECELYYTNAWFYDFYIDLISQNSEIETWSIFRYLCEECPYLLTYEDACVIIDRPSELYLDRELAPHAEGKAAIKFADGYELYCNHGTVIPAKYGRIHPSEWRSESILADDTNNANEDLIGVISLLTSIGYKRFSEELPDRKEQYWTKGGSPRKYNSFIGRSIEYILNWLHFYYYDYYNFGEDYYTIDESTDWETYRNNIEGRHGRLQLIYENLPFKISEELKFFYHMYEIEYQLAPGLDFQPLSQATLNLIPKFNAHLLPIFHGNRQEIYYILCDNIQRPIAPVYCQLPNEEPILYAECLGSLITMIAQCYRDGGYYVAINEQSGKKEIKQNLDKIEPIFEKFNPEQIDNWRKIWKPVR
jgi:hypothetical protein